MPTGVAEPDCIVQASNAPRTSKNCGVVALTSICVAEKKTRKLRFVEHD